MQKKTILIIAGALVLGLCAFLFIRSKYLVKPGKTEVIAFLEKFTADVNAGEPDKLSQYFDSDKKAKQLNKILNLLCNKTGSDGEKPLFYVSLAADQSEIKLINPEILEAKIPAQFTKKVNDGDVSQTSLVLRLRKVSAGVFKIVRIDAREFFKDYIAYEHKINPDQKITPAYYSPITLAAFKTAEQLKARYDSVLWFEHVNNKTFYYVIKGKWNYKVLNNPDEDQATGDDIAKMGLVNPDLKEIIPVEYDLIHNISGTVDGLIEVEKGTKKGFYDLTGKNVVAVNYDQILPLEEGANLAILRNGDDYFYLTKEMVITPKITDLKIADILPQIKRFNSSYTLSDSTSKNIMEDNSRDSFTTNVISPSYLVDWKILPRLICFRDPLRKYGSDQENEEEAGSGYYQITFDGYTEKSNWLASAFYSLVDDYLGGRAGLYQTKSVLLIDKNKNKVLGYKAQTYFGPGEGGAPLSGKCNNDYLRAINDTLFEYRTTCRAEQLLHDQSTLDEAPHYYYLHIKNGKLEALPDKLLFSFTKYVKMNDTYLNSCYVVNDKAVDHTTIEILRYMKNEIYGQYGYSFKDTLWTKVFQQRFYNFDDDKKPVNINDSLTVIDKYNVNFIDQKLKGTKAPAKVLAAK